ncbi:type IV toxin-antitoxin system AbiEi family antitoxin domain-containing protein [Gordonia soli]|nr:type IV toxin-antitoxin system AbiEi family antitoxin domain-containing protein [Gordonia soli]
MDYASLIRNFGGVVSTAQLLRTGATPREIREAVATGHLTRLRQGWYATPDADPEIQNAVMLGGTLTCASSLTRSGLWVPESTLHKSHYRRSRHHEAFLGQECGRFGRPTKVVAAVDDVMTSLQYAAHCIDTESFIVICDSALHLGVVTITELESAFAHAPDRIRRAIDRCDGRSESGTETMARLRLISAGMRVRIQVFVAGVGRIDLIIGDLLAIEIDSFAHHTGEVAYESDRLRDRNVLLAGLIPMRLTYAQVVHRWPRTFFDIQQLVRRGVHRDRSR